MKKKTAAIVLASVMTFSFTACGNAAVDVPSDNNEVAETEEEPQTGMANPWEDCTEDEAYELTPNGFSAPEGSTNVSWHIMREPAEGLGPMVQLNFDYDDLSFCAREQAYSGESIVDISGMYYDWQTTESVTLANWAGGNMAGEIRAFKNDDESAQICLWFDIETGYAYSLSVAAPDLDGFDIRAVAEAIYDPEKQIGANMPDEEDVSGEGEGATDAALPAYVYPGPEEFYSVMYKYMVDEYDGNYPDADVGIPCPIIVAMDDSDIDDIRVWGLFWYFKYDLNGDVLECQSGGSYPGCMHFKQTDAGYDVTGMEVVEDGSGYDESAKKIFGDYYDGFTSAVSNDELREETRAQIIANYAAANDLKITAFKDYGWDPVSLPEENIDSFYSIPD